MCWFICVLSTSPLSRLLRLFDWCASTSPHCSAVCVLHNCFTPSRSYCGSVAWITTQNVLFGSVGLDPRAPLSPVCFPFRRCRLKTIFLAIRWPQRWLGIPNVSARRHVLSAFLSLGELISRFFCSRYSHYPLVFPTDLFLPHSE